MNGKSSFTSAWHYRPPLPLRFSPVFSRPFNIKAVIRWFIGGWLPLSERLLILVFSLISWQFFQPSATTAKTLDVDWIAPIYLRNFLLISLVAGSLHGYLYVWRCQGNHRRYDSRALPRQERKFLFSNQVRDNMFWTLVSGVSVWTAYEVGVNWAVANEIFPTLSGPGAGIWLLVLLFLIPIWETVYFFLIHRLLHVPMLYRSVHALHHRNTNVGPWSGLSMHPVEHVIYLGSVLIHWIVPSHPLLVIFHLQYFVLSAVTTHAGYEGLTKGRCLWLRLGTFHHQLHHRYFECNYGALEIPWDRWLGTFHNGTEASHRGIIERRRQKIGHRIK